MGERTFQVQKNQSRRASIDASEKAWMPALVPAVQVDESCQGSQSPNIAVPLTPRRYRPQSLNELLNSPAIDTPNVLRLQKNSHYEL